MTRQHTVDQRLIVAPLHALGDCLTRDERDSFIAASLPAVSLERHGDLKRWFEVLERLALQACPCELGTEVRIGAHSLSGRERDQLQQALEAFCPWRKGPFSVFGIDVDAEWRSNLKWDRIRPHVDFENRRVLDVGCGNGYYALRAIGAGARCVVGVDPLQLFLLQFSLLNGWANAKAAVLPLRLSELPPSESFDVVLSLGVLGHRKQPHEHLEQLRARCHPGSPLVVETLIVDGAGESSLRPEGRYAAMRNVYELPTPARLCRWIEAAGFEDVAVVDKSRTTTAEQRATPWMQFQSLTDFLDPANPTLTREGHPAPVRAVVVGRAR